MESITDQSRPLRYVIVGGGASIASSHLQALAQLPAQVVGISDINSEHGSAGG